MAFITTYYRELVTIRDIYAPGIPIFCTATTSRGRPTAVFGLSRRPVALSRTPRARLDAKARGHDLNVGCDIVKMLLQRFDAHLRQEIAGKFPNVIVVATQGTVTQPGLWDNETHLKAEGFTKIAERFASAIKARFP